MNTPRSLFCVAFVATTAAVGVSYAAELTPITVIGLLAPSPNTLVFDRDELARFGDGGDLSEVLRRLPGVQISPEGRVQLRGMGNGYTRIEVNGEAVGGLGAGPVLDGLTVDMVEQVELVRGASATNSGEAVAGILRITTRAASGSERLRVSTQWGADAGRPSATLGLVWSGSLGDVDYQLSARAKQRRVAPRDQTDGASLDADGAAYATSQTGTVRTNQTGGLSMEPQIVWRASPRDTLTFTSMAEKSMERLDTDQTYSLQAPWPADYASMPTRERSHTWSLRPQMQWKHRLDNGDRFTVDVGGNRSWNVGSWAQQQWDATGSEISSEDQQWRTRQSGHHLGLRWDVATNDALHWVLGHRVDAEAQRETDTEGGDESHSSVQRRQTATFVQAIAQLAPGWKLEAGLRHERTQLDVADDSMARQTAQGIWLPSATLAWSLDAQRTLRLNAGRTYRSPRLKDLSPSRRSTSWNVPGNPDTEGNPLLQPERATGIELGLAQLLDEDGQQGEFGITLLQRRIQQRIQYQLDWVDDRWLLAPVNAGGARVQGLELDGRWALDHTAAALPLTLRGSLGLYRTRLDDVASPNGLPGQPRALLNLGFDVHSARWPLSWGGNLNVAPGYIARTSSQQTVDTGVRRALDLYAQWQFDPRTRLRLNASQLGARNTSVSYLMTDTYGNAERTALRQTRLWAASVALEKEF
ncbi:MAG: TonB-dependent receptor [Burkholderiales bacterium]|nr:TonB-dependent receptor [Burkholderiales bacterium]